MKNSLKINLFLFATLTLFGVACNQEKPHSDAGGYYCPMHPTVESQTPGICPVCNMDLVARNSQGSAETLSTEELAAGESPIRKIFANVRTVKGKYGSIEQSIIAEGVIEFDQRARQSVTARFSGRVEELFVSANFSRVKKGQILATIYSAEALEAQRTFAEAVKSGNKQLEAASRQRLIRLGLNEELLEKISNGLEIRNIPLTSPVSGYLIAEQGNIDQSPNPIKDEMMGQNISSVSPAPKISLRKGEFVTAGQTLFIIAEDNHIRLDINLSQADLERVKPGHQITGKTKGGQEFKGTISLIEPDGSEVNSFRKARVYFSADNLQVGSLVRIEISSGKEEGLWLPGESIMDLGTRVLVFIKKENHFFPHQVITGSRSNGKIKIIKGLSSMDEVAAVASLLADSDGFLNHLEEIPYLSEAPDTTQISTNNQGSSNAIMMTERAIQLAGIKAMEVKNIKLTAEIHFNAKITNDPGRRQVFSTQIPGRIEKFFFRETGKNIRVGDVVAEVYSPEILTIVSELKISRKEGDYGKPLATANLNKLKRYGFSEAEVNGLLTQAELPETIKLKSTVSGTITAVESGPGKTVVEGSPLLVVEDLSVLWAEAEVHPGDLPSMVEGKTVKVGLPGSSVEEVTGKVEQLLPALKDNTQLGIARIKIKNHDNFYRPGQLARVTLITENKQGFVIPSDAVIDSRNESIVFILTGKNTFERRTVETGARIHGQVEIISGIKPGEYIAASGAYLINSQMVLKGSTK